MKEKIEKLIQEYKERKVEIFEQVNELSKINKTKISKEDKRVLEDQILLLEKEYSLRNYFIVELENII